MKTLKGIFGLDNPTLKQTQDKFLPNYLNQGDKYLVNPKKPCIPLQQTMERIY